MNNVGSLLLAFTVVILSPFQLGRAAIARQMDGGRQRGATKRVAFVA
jgi:hypothetical protein